jgi:hypothetical protein
VTSFTRGSEGKTSAYADVLVPAEGIVLVDPGPAGVPGRAVGYDTVGIDIPPSPDLPASLSRQP